MKTDFLNFSKVSPLLNCIIKVLEDHFGDEVLSVALFGFVARGKGSSTSDLDLFIVHKEGTKRIIDNFSMILQEIRNSKEYLSLKNEGFLPDPFPLFVNESKLKEHPWILLDIVEDGIILLDKEGILKHELELLQNNLKLLGSKKIVLDDGFWYWDLKPDWKPGEVIRL